MSRIQNGLHSLVAFGVLALGSVAAQEQAQVEIDVIAVTGEFAHGGGGGQFKSFDRPVLNESGDIAFRATLYPGFRGVTESNNTGIWRKRPHTQVHKIARTGDYTSPFKPYGPEPEVTRARYGSLADPQIGPDGRVTFLTHLALPSEDSFIGAHNNEMIFTMKELSAGMLDVAQEKGSKAPMISFVGGGNGQKTTDSNGKRTWFKTLRPPAVMPDGTIVFSASLQMNGYDGVSGVWYYQKPDGEDPSLINPNYGSIVRPDPTGTSLTEVTSPYLGAGHNKTLFYGSGEVATDASDTAEKTEGIWWDYYSPGPAVVTSSPDGCAHGHRWDEIGKPSYFGNGDFAFRATLRAEAPSEPPAHQEGIWFVQGSGWPEEIALEGNHALGFPADVVFDHFGDPATPYDAPSFVAVSFAAQLRKGDRGTPSHASAVYAYVSGHGRPEPTLRLIAKTGDSAPGAGGATFKTFGSPLVNDSGKVAFTAKLEPTPEFPASHGIWMMNPQGQLSLIAKSGSPISLPSGGARAVQWIECTKINNDGQAAVRISFADGTEAVALVSPESLDPPDFDSWAEARIPDPSRRDKSQDSDGDGIPNLLEFAFGADPTIADLSRSPKAEVGTYDSPYPTGGSPTLGLTYYELANSTNISYSFESSTDLHNWEEIVNSHLLEVERVLLPDGTYRVHVQDNRPITDTKPRFMRLKVFSP